MSTPLIIRSLSMGYLQTEDRLWLRLSLTNNTSRQIWLTRYLTEKMIQGLADMLQKSYQDVPLPFALDRETALKFEHEEATQLKTEANVGQGAVELQKKPKDEGVCSTIEFKKIADFQWQVTWNTLQNSAYTMQPNRIEMHQLLQSLLRQQRLVNWRIDHQHDWLLQDSAPAA